ncbi:MAG: hypothetical protein IIC50_20460, partial [Planctomycetes bacterium]|nr:hypothetical protein [Planctomycetota bacterium]
QTLFDFTVSLSGPAGQDVTVEAATQAGSAVNPMDFSAVNTTVTLPAGQTQASVRVAVNGDADPEANETFTVLLSHAQGATIVDGVGIGTIENDDVVSTTLPFEQFSGDSDLFDLAFTSIEFTPGSPGDPYSIVRQAIQELPTDPAGGSALDLGDDDSQRVNLSQGHTVSLYGQSFSSFYVGSNGYITFTAGDSDFSPSLEDHLDTARVSALFHDLDPTAGGTISTRELDDRVVITWEDISEYGRANSNTFQVELYYDGRIALSWLDVDVRDGLVGLSDGLGVRSGLTEIDFSVL